MTVHHPIPDPRGGDPGLRRDRDAARRTADRARGDALDLCLEPTVVAAGAHRRADLRVQLGPDARLTVLEQVLLGRSGEDPGRWAGTTRIERSGIPLLHTTVGLGPEEPAWLPPVAPRAYASAVHIGDEKTEVASGDDAVRLPLPGGWVTTAWGAELRRVAAAAETLARA